MPRWPGPHRVIGGSKWRTIGPATGGLSDTSTTPLLGGSTATPADAGGAINQSRSKHASNRGFTRPIIGWCSGLRGGTRHGSMRVPASPLSAASHAAIEVIQPGFPVCSTNLQSALILGPIVPAGN
ncbi:MAG: hypothetical protein QOG54_2532 [Actinomycetota bacterium]|nr:hypothetical protein [Actinomycetota bacterium]